MPQFFLVACVFYHNLFFAVNCCVCGWRTVLTAGVCDFISSQRINGILTSKELDLRYNKLPINYESVFIPRDHYSV